MQVFDKIWNRFAWLRHLTVAVIYGAGVMLFWQISFSHLLLISGLRFSVFLFVPYRYWPALLVGDSLAFAHLSYVCVDEFGSAWALARLLPSIGLAMPVVCIYREQCQSFQRNVATNFGALLLASLLAAMLITLHNLGMLWLAKVPAGYVTRWSAEVGRYFLGNYLGILTITPSVLFVRKMLLERSWQSWPLQRTEAHQLLEVAFFMSLALVWLRWFGLNMTTESDWRQFVQIMMFFPVLCLALRYGWEGAAVGGTLASVAIVALMPEKYDLHTIKAQVMIAFAISTMLMVGSRISVFKDQAQRDRVNVQRALALAKRNVTMSEMRARSTSHALEHVHELMQTVYTMMLGRLRFVIPTHDGQRYQQQATVAQDKLYRVADGLYPIMWRQYGLPSILSRSSLPRALEESGITYKCDFRGPVSRLSRKLHYAIYRLVCEIVADACSGKNISLIDVRVRCGVVYNQHGWVLMRARLRSRPEDVEQIRWDELRIQVAHSVSGLGWQAIEDCVSTYGGRVCVHSAPDGRLISLTLYDSI